MAKFELNIYGEDDEIIKKYETDHIRFGVLITALEVNEKKLNAKEQFEAVGRVLKSVFAGLTDEELKLADTGDIFSTYTQVLRQAGNINGSDNSKN